MEAHAVAPACGGFHGSGRSKSAGSSQYIPPASVGVATSRVADYIGADDWGTKAPTIALGWQPRNRGKDNKRNEDYDSHPARDLITCSRGTDSRSGGHRMSRIFIVEDHALFRNLLVDSLKKMAGVEICGTSATAEAAPGSGGSVIPAAL